MHPEALYESTSVIWSKCGFLENFYLAGGTALALQIGHRRSIDLDFFSDSPIKSNLLKKVEEEFGPASNILKNSKDELTLVVKEVKLTFLHYPFPLLYPKITSPVVPLASLKDIASMKAYSLGRRRSLKDYIDLYFIFSKNLYTLTSTTEDARKKYHEAFNDRLFFEQLLDPNDLEDEPIDWIIKPVAFKEMKNLFQDKIKEIKL